MPLLVDKGRCLKYILEYYEKRKLEEVIAFGDTYNDLEMLLVSG